MDHLENLKKLFGTEEIHLLSDNTPFLKEASRLGFKAVLLDEIDEIPEHSVNVSFSDSGAAKVFELSDKNENSNVVFCAAHVFDCTLDTALYCLNQLCMSDYLGSVRKQESIINSLSLSRKIDLHGDGTSATVSINNNKPPNGIFMSTIEKPFVLSAAEFFEVHYSHVDESEPCPFNVNGTIKIKGMLYVLRPTGENPYESSSCDAKSLCEYIANSGSTLIEVKDNMIEKILVDGKDISPLVGRLSGSTGLQLTEFAVGVNGRISESVDYSINSQLNEGVDGVHIAIGNGSSGYHMDFLSPNTTITPVKV